MSLTVTIEKQSEVVQTLTEPIESGDLTGLLAALKSAKTRTNESLTELVEAEKSTVKTAEIVKIPTDDPEEEDEDEDN